MAVHGRNSTVVVSNGIPSMSFSTTPLDSGKMRGDRRRRNRIIGGETAASGEYPWFGLTIITIDRHLFGTISVGCGSSFIHSDIVMSAAHCIVDAIRVFPRANIQVEIYAGWSEGTYDSVYQVSDIYWPRSYAFPKAGDDLVFYKVTSPTSVTPVSWNTDPAVPSVGENGTAIGHGQTVSGGPTSNTLQKTKISVITNAECGAYFNQTIDSWGVCAFTPGQSLCLGDSGGPMLTPSGILFGVNSFVLYPNECDQGPSGFVRVSSYTDMLASVSFVVVVVVVVGPIRCKGRKFTTVHAATSYPCCRPFLIREPLSFFAVFQVICDYSTDPPIPCDGFGDSNEMETYKVHTRCGLFGFRSFCFLSKIFSSLFNT